MPAAPPYRALIDGDAPAIQALLEASGPFHWDPEGEAPGPDAAATLLHDRPPGHPREAKWLLGMEEDGQLVGVWDILRDYPVAGRWVLGLFLLHPDHRGEGLGARAYALVEAWIRDQGAERVGLGVRFQNPRARPFWARMGYQVLREAALADAADPDTPTVWVMEKELRRPDDAAPLTFRPMDIARDEATCVRFQREAFTASFGDDSLFQEFGEAAYITRLTLRSEAFPEGYLHGWRDGAIVAQVECRPRPDEPGVGYVTLFSVTPEHRGQGLGAQLDAYVTDLFTRHGCHTLRLSVSPTNAGAVRFYTRLGWRDRGVRPDATNVRFMEKRLG